MPARCFDWDLEIVSLTQIKLAVADRATVIFGQVLIFDFGEDGMNPFVNADAEVFEGNHDFLKVRVSLFPILDQSGEMRESQL